MEHSRTYSYSMINTFNTCPRKFEAQYITKEIKFKQSEAALWGSDVHKALEDRIKLKKPLGERFKTFERYAQAVENTPGKHEAEKELAYDEDYKLVGWWDKSAFIRGKLDVLTDLTDKAIITDWKTNAKGAATAKYQIGEMETFSWLTFLLKPEIEKIKTVLVWVATPDAPTVWPFDRQHDFNKLQDKCLGWIDKIEDAVHQDRFPLKDGPLCAWCDLTSCPNWRERR